MNRSQCARRLAGAPIAVWALLVAVPVEVGLRTMSLDRLTALLHIPLLDPSFGAPATGAPGSVPPWARQRLTIAFRAMQRWPFDEKCLRRSLVGACLVHSLSPTLTIGVAIVDGKVRAHAWLAIDGVDLDPAAAQFGVLRPVLRS